MSRILGRTSLILAVAVAVLALAAPVSAAKPDRSFAPAGDIVVSGICEFDVLIETVANNEYFTTFFDRSGNVTRMQVAGHLVQRTSRVGGDTSIVLNVSGPGKFVDGDEGLVVDTHGTWLLFFAGQLFTLSGHGVFLVADTETIVSRHGHIVELCSILAG
jgi:hypothetical protein